MSEIIIPYVPALNKRVPRLAVDFGSIPAGLKRRVQWMNWKLRGARKIPMTPYGQRADPCKRSTWVPHEEAAVAYVRDPERFAGIAIALSAQDSLWAMDFDHCRAPNGDLEPWAREIYSACHSYAEWSFSGDGMHLYGRFPRGTRLPAQIHAHSNRLGLYTARQMMCVTGYRIDDAPRNLYSVDPDVIMRIARQEFGTQMGTLDGTHARRTHADAAEYAAHTDAEVFCTLRERSPKFAKLAEGDWSGYPSYSEGEMAALCCLARALGDAADRILRLYRQTALWRPAWESHADHDVTKAIAYVAATGHRVRPASDEARVVAHVQRRWAPTRPADAAAVVGCTEVAARVGLWRAAERGQVQRVGYGLYAPLGWDAPAADSRGNTGGAYTRDLMVTLSGGDVTFDTDPDPATMPVSDQVICAVAAAGVPINAAGIASAMGREPGDWLRTWLTRLVNAGRLQRTCTRGHYVAAPVEIHILADEDAEGDAVC